MSTHKHIDIICLVGAILSLVLCAVFMNEEALGIQTASRAMGYESRLFDTGKVHTIDIVIDDWEGFLETARSEEYSVCSVVIDGEAISNVGIRGKGNTSLSNVASMDSDRYSFKIEFDQYDSTKSYHGLDKLSLNNIIQDNTYMKDYLTYQMMGEFGVAAPLCSYAYLTVNGEDWGLYLAVEAVEESFLQRNYGSNYGDLYKPDSMEMGGGHGNGREFEMPEFIDGQENANSTAASENGQTQGSHGNKGNMMRPGASENADGSGETNAGEAPSVERMPGGFGSFKIDEETIRTAWEELGLDTTVLDGIDFDNITAEDMQSILADLDEETVRNVMRSVIGSGNMQMPDRNGGGGMGSSETKLQYIDDDPTSYSTIFSSAKTDVTEADQKRLISSLKQLSAYENLENVVNIDDVLRYFVVHNYVVNGDSYTGNMIHNYYLYEEDGRLFMIPWDYNLAFGTFQSSSAISAVNDDIDEVLSDRPMQAWIFSDETYRQQYYALYAELLEQVDVQAIIDNAYQLIAPYVEKDPTAFCTYEEFQTGVKALKEFCTLRSESVRRQLASSTEAVAVGTLDLSDMGTMNMDGGRGNMGGMGFGNRGNVDNTDAASEPGAMPQFETQGTPGTENAGESIQPDVMETPEGMQMPGGMEIPEGVQSPGGQSDPISGKPDSSSENTPTAEWFPMPGQGGGEFQFPDQMNGGAPAAPTQSTVVLLVASAIILLVGLMIAKKYRH